MSKLDSVSVADLREIVCACDGWSIFPADMDLLQKLPKDFRTKLVRTYESDMSDPKATIFGPNGEVKKSMEGIYALPLLYAVGGALGVDTSVNAIGRGFQARELQRRIEQKLQEMENAASPQTRG